MSVAKKYHASQPILASRNKAVDTTALTYREPTPWDGDRAGRLEISRIANDLGLTQQGEPRRSGA